MRNNVVTATRIYQKRVDAAMKIIICNQSNPLSVKHYSTKLEFQAQGAGHHHGTLWLDIERIEEKINVCQLNKIKIGYSNHPAICQCNRYLDSHLKDATDELASLNEFMLSREIPINLSNTNRKRISLKYLRTLTSLQGKTELSENYKKNSYVI